MGAADFVRTLAVVASVALLPGPVGATDMASALDFKTADAIEAWAQARFAQAGHETYRFSRPGKDVLALAKEEPAGIAFHTEVPILMIPWAGVQVGFESVPNTP